MKAVGAIASDGGTHKGSHGLVGGILLERFGVDLGIRKQTASRIAAATIGTVVVVLIARLVS